MKFPLNASSYAVERLQNTGLHLATNSLLMSLQSPTCTEYAMLSLSDSVTDIQLMRVLDRVTPSPPPTRVPASYGKCYDLNFSICQDIC